MINVLKAVIAFLVMILVAIATSWVNGVNADREDVHTLKREFKYLHGDLNLPTANK